MTSKTDMNAEETPEGAETVCPTCKGEGWLSHPVWDGPDVRCAPCEGTGRLAEKGAPQ